MDKKNGQNTLTSSSGEIIGKNAILGEKEKKEIIEDLDIKNHQNYKDKIKFIRDKKNLKKLIKEDPSEEDPSEKNIFIEFEEKHPEENTEINRYIIKDIKKEIESEYQRKTAPEYMKDSLEWMERIIIGKRIKNKNLRRSLQIQRGEIFPVKANKPEKKVEEHTTYIRFQIDKNDGMHIFKNSDGSYKILEKDEDVLMIGVDAKTGAKIPMPTVTAKDRYILKEGDYFLRRHIDDDAYMGDMEATMLEAKKIVKNNFKDKKIKIIVSSSWLFDPEFIEHLKKFTKNSNMIKVREETKEYGGYLPSTPSENYKNCIHRKKETSLTKAVDTYKDENGKPKEIKDGGSFVDLEAVEEWYKNNKSQNT